MGRKFKHVEDVKPDHGEPIRKMRYVLKDYATRTKIDREKKLRQKRLQKAR